MAAPYFFDENPVLRLIKRLYRILYHFLLYSLHAVSLVLCRLMIIRQIDTGLTCNDILVESI